MSEPNTTSDMFTLNIKREFSVEPQVLFDYFTQPEHLVNWFAPNPEMKTKVHQLDLEVGGRFEIAMIDEVNETTHVVEGIYTEISPPSRLIYSWSWKSKAEDETSQVTLSLNAINQGTALEILHERFVTEESRDKHGQGWNGCLDRLQNLSNDR